MICYACRSPHDEEPPLCWGTGCTCQHHPEGSATPPPPPEPSNEVVGYVCNGCDIALDSAEEECDCAGDPASRTAIFKDDIIEP